MTDQLYVVTGTERREHLGSQVTVAILHLMKILHHVRQAVATPGLFGAGASLFEHIGPRDF